MLKWRRLWIQPGLSSWFQRGQRSQGRSWEGQWAEIQKDNTDRCLRWANTGHKHATEYWRALAAQGERERRCVMSNLSKYEMKSVRRRREGKMEMPGEIKRLQPNLDNGRSQRRCTIKNGLLNHHRWKWKCWFQENATITLPAPTSGPESSNSSFHRVKKSWRTRRQSWRAKDTLLTKKMCSRNVLLMFPLSKKNKNTISECSKHPRF